MGFLKMHAELDKLSHLVPGVDRKPVFLMWGPGLVKLIFKQSSRPEWSLFCRHLQAPKRKYECELNSTDQFISPNSAVRYFHSSSLGKKAVGDVGRRQRSGTSLINNPCLGEHKTGERRFSYHRHAFKLHLIRSFNLYKAKHYYSGFIDEGKAHRY